MACGKNEEVTRERVRKKANKKLRPSEILDSQSVKTAEGGEKRGFDGGKGMDANEPDCRTVWVVGAAQSHCWQCSGRVCWKRGFARPEP